MKTMKYPNFNEEKKLWKKGHELVAGIDEAGRGPLAGPVIACALVISKPSVSFLKKININDSKKISKKEREEIYEILKNNPEVKWGIGRVSEKVIDKINILEATKLVMKRAIKNLKLSEIEYLLIDGNFKINSEINQKSIISGDQKVVSIAAASIIAKVYRDKMMERYHRKYPEYGFNKNMGYGTSFHRKQIKKNGFCPIHRKTFRLFKARP